MQWTLISLAVGIAASQHVDVETSGQCLLQAKRSSSKNSDYLDTGITIENLVAAEALFAHKVGESDHGDVGGDRMSQRRHNYSPIYSKYLTLLLQTGDVETRNIQTVAEVGILTGTGLAMWSHIFPTSHIFGFDKNTSSYQNNLEHLRSLGFNDDIVKVTAMNQMQDNVELLKSVLGEHRPAVVIDDGYHIPAAGLSTFLSMQPYLAENFVYFIEDLVSKDIDAGDWDTVQDGVSKKCPSCTFSYECPSVSDKPECIAVIHNLHGRGGETGDHPQDALLQKSHSSSNLTGTYTLEPQHRQYMLRRPDYDTVETTMPWEKGVVPIVQCPTKKEQAARMPQQSVTDMDANLQQAVDTYCLYGLDDFVEFYVDPKFKGNYDRLKDKDGWIDKAFLSYMGLHNGTKDTISAEADLLVQSIHHFSEYPVVMTNFGTLVPKNMNPERFPRLVLMHARKSATAIGKDFNFNKLNSMLFTKVKGGAVLDADQFVIHGVDIMMNRAFEETTKQYPYPVLPGHWMSRDPDDHEQKRKPDYYAFSFKSKGPTPRRSMRWGHAHPTWTHYALPWLARWTSYVLEPEKAGCPAWLKDQLPVEDEEILNLASWADGLTKQWCKFDIPRNSDFGLFLDQTKKGFGVYVHGENNSAVETEREEAEEHNYAGYDDKFFPKGIPHLFITSHFGKDPSDTYKWLKKLWRRDLPSKYIFYDHKWFDSGEALKTYDPQINCIA